MRTLTTTSILLLSLTISKGQFDFIVLQDQKAVNELISIFKILPESTMTTTLSNIELDAATSLMTKCISYYNNQVQEEFVSRGEKKRHARMYQIMSLSKYKIQFVPYMNSMGEKEIWINGFCSDYNIDWKTEIVHVFDGGNCYFTVRLNISNNNCIGVGTNGYS